MTPEQLRTLLTPEGLRLLDQVGEIGSKSDIVRIVSKLRALGHSAELVSVVLAQARLRTRARARFGEFAEKMLFTPAGLEQATRLSVAAIHAGRFQSAGVNRVADLGCGIGADSLALSSLGLSVTAYEQDEVTAAVATYNLAVFPNARVFHQDVFEAKLDDSEVFWCDPSRRVADKRLSNPQDWSPSLDKIFALATQKSAGIKLAPGLDHQLIPAGVEAQWISVAGELVEVTVWSGQLARPGVARAALVVSEGAAAEITGGGAANDVEPGVLAEYLVEPDSAVIRSRLIGDLARQLGGHMLDPTIAWISAETRPDTPFGQRFRVREILPLDERQLSGALRVRKIGTLEIKKRGVAVNPTILREKLKLRGTESATLILTRISGKRTAILAERLVD